MPALDPLDKATQRLLDSIADRAVEKKADRDAQSTRIEKKSDLEKLLDRYRLWLKMALAGLAFFMAAGSALYGYVQSYVTGRVHELEAETAAARERDEAAKVLRDAAGHVQVEHVSPETVKAIKRDAKTTGETIDALVEYNRQSHEYLLEVVATGKRKPPKPPELKAAESKLDAIERAKAEKLRKESELRAPVDLERFE